MPCPHCAAAEPVEQSRRTALGYGTIRCFRRRRICNDRTAPPRDHRRYPIDLVLPVVLWRLRHKLSLGDLTEMFLARGFVSSHEAIRDREARFAPPLTDRLRARRRGHGGTQWHADKTSLRIDGRWCSP